MVDEKRGAESRAKVSDAARSKPMTSGRGGSLSGTRQQAQRSTEPASDITAKARIHSVSCLKFIQSLSRSTNKSQTRAKQGGHKKE